MEGENRLGMLLGDALILMLFFPSECIHWLRPLG